MVAGRINIQTAINVGDRGDTRSIAAGQVAPIVQDGTEAAP
jgi:hypothetical protein